MYTVEQLNPLEGAGETASSTEIPHRETVGSPELKRARLEDTLEDEQERTGRDETEQIGPENILMTKSRRKPYSAAASSILDRRQFDREISFHQLPEGDIPLYQGAERVQWDEGITNGSVKIHSSVDATKIRQQVPRDVCAQDLHILTKTLVYWTLPVTPCP